MCKMSNADLVLFQIYFMYHLHWFILIVIRMLSTHKLNLIKWKVHINIVCAIMVTCWDSEDIGFARTTFLFFYLFIQLTNYQKHNSTQRFDVIIYGGHASLTCITRIRVCQVRIISFSNRSIAVIEMCPIQAWLPSHDFNVNFRLFRPKKSIYFLHIVLLIVEFGFVTYLISFLNNEIHFV